MADKPAQDASSSRQHTPRDQNSRGGRSSPRNNNTLANQGVFSAPEHIAPPLPKIVRQPEELSKTAERLARPRTVPEPTDGKMLSPRVVKPVKEIEVSINRLYTTALQQHKQALEKAEKAAEAAATPRRPVSPRKADEEGGDGKLSEEQVAESVNRLYVQAIQHQKQVHEQMVHKYAFHPPQSPRTTPAAASARLYTAALERRQKCHEKMFERYVNHSLPSYRKITPDEVKTSAQRLSTSRKNS